MAKPPQPNPDEDYSPSTTLVPFDRPIPLLRVPVLAGAGDYVLAFRDRRSFFSALNLCESKLLEQCHAGVRIGCSIAASNKCATPWWKVLFGSSGKIDYKKREECEEREMTACLEGSKEKCLDFAKEKCLGAFNSSRVACRERKLRRKEVGRLISCVSRLGDLNGNAGLAMILLDQLDSLVSSDLFYEVTNYRGSELLKNNNPSSTIMCNGDSQIPGGLR